MSPEIRNVPVYAWTSAPEQVGVHVASFSATSSGSGVGQTKCSVSFEVLDVLIVDIDIRPGSDPNGLNPRNNGVVPVAILTSDSFDATTVDLSTVVFGINGAAPTHTGGHIDDVDGDGDNDLLLHFRTGETGIECGDTSATLSVNPNLGCCSGGPIKEVVIWRLKKSV